MAVRILFLCTHNSSRSQMAEGLARAIAPADWVVASAGTDPRGVNPLAVRAMAELGIDLRDHRSKSLDELLHQPWDYVVTLCDDAHEACPVFPGGRNRLHVGFPDPSAVEGDEATRLQAFRGVRDAIRQWIERWIPSLDRASA